MPTTKPAPKQLEMSEMSTWEEFLSSAQVKSNFDLQKHANMVRSMGVTFKAFRKNLMAQKQPGMGIQVTPAVKTGADAKK